MPSTSARTDRRSSTICSAPWSPRWFCTTRATDAGDDSIADDLRQACAAVLSDLSKADFVLEPKGLRIIPDNELPHALQAAGGGIFVGYDALKEHLKDGEPSVLWK